MARSGAATVRGRVCRRRLDLGIADPCRFDPGEVVLIRIEFHQTPGGKLRQAVVLLDAGDDDFVAAPITSVPEPLTSMSLLTKGAIKNTLPAFAFTGGPCWKSRIMCGPPRAR